MIWGRTLQPGHTYTEQLNEEVHLSLAALESRHEHANDKSYSQVVLSTGEAEQLLCTLVHGVIFQQCLDLRLMPEEMVTFKVQGSSAVYITGYTIKTPQMHHYMSNGQDAEYADSIDYEVCDESRIDSEICENISENDAEYSQPIDYEVGGDRDADEDTEICETVAEQEDIVIKAEMDDCVFSDTVGAESFENNYESEMIPCETEELNSLQKRECPSTVLNMHSANALTVAVADNKRIPEVSSTAMDQQSMPNKVPFTSSCTVQPGVHSRLQLLATSTALTSPTCMAKRQSNNDNQRPSTTPTDKQFLSTTNQCQSRPREALQPLANQTQSGLQRQTNRLYERSANKSHNANNLEVNNQCLPQPVKTSLSGLVSHERQSSYYNFKQSSVTSTQYQEAVNCSTSSGHDARLHHSLQVGMEVLYATTGHVEIETEQPPSGAIQTPSHQTSNSEGTVSVQHVPSTYTYLPTASPGYALSTRIEPPAKRVIQRKTSKVHIAQSSQSFQARSRDKSFLCRFCNKDCHRAGSLLLHERTHMGIKPFKCLYCRKGFADRSNKVKHERIHTGVKPFKCEQCGNAYSDPSAKRRHQESCLRRTANFNTTGREIAVIADDSSDGTGGTWGSGQPNMT